MPLNVDDFTIGVEEEYQIVDPQSRELVQRAGRVLPRTREAVGDEATHELFLSQIEVGTPVCRTLADVRAELVRLRGEVIAAAAQNGCRIVAAGTHPFSRWEDQRVTPKERYRGLAKDYQQLAREQIIFGCHVHVGIADRELAIRVMNRVRPWLATLLAVSGNSPFWLGVDTGYASYRTELFQRLPTVGTPQVLASRAEYDEVVASLIAIGLIEDGSKIYWDVRPSSRFETLEFRVADVCTTIDEAVMVAGLCRALARECAARELRGEPYEHARPELLRAAQWYAARHGLDGELIDVGARRAVAAGEQVEALLAFVRSSLEAAGDRDEVTATVRRVIEQGSGARRQRAAFEQGGRLEDVIDMLVTETARGLD